MKEANEVTVELTEKFEYAFKGEQREAGFVLLYPPTMRQHSQAAALKQSISRIIASAVEGVEREDEDENKDGKDSSITSKMVINTIYSSACVEANVVWQQAKALFKEGVALIDGEQKMTTPLVEKMSPDDFENLVGEYVANFILV